MSDYIDTRRGSIGPEARTRLSEAVRQLQAAQAKRSTNLPEAIAHANGASMLAAQAQSMANADAQAAQRAYAGHYGGGGESNMGAVLGGIIIGNILGGSMGGGGWQHGRGSELDVVRRVRRRRGAARPLLAARPFSRRPSLAAPLRHYARPVVSRARVSRATRRCIRRPIDARSRRQRA